MSRVLTNNTSLSYAIESALGVLPGSPTWHELEPNTIGAFGATITTVARSPISKNRQRRKGTVTDLDSAVDFEGDLTLAHFTDFAEGFCFSVAVNQDLDFVGGDGTATGYTVAALITAQTAKLHFNATGNTSLIYARGYAVTANNGLNPLDSQPIDTDTELTTANAVVETAPTNATVDIAGIRAETGDLDITVAANVATITSGNETPVATIDFTALGLTVGQQIHVGGLTSGEQFTGSLGYGRITSIAAATLVLDKIDATLITAAGTTDTVDLLFGRFIRNVPTDSAEFLERSYHIEQTFPDLDSVGVDMYEYAKGNFVDSIAITMPLADKATVAVGFIGTDTVEPTVTRETNAAAALSPARTGAFNTTSDCLRLRIAELDESGIYTDFKSVTITLANNVSPEKVLCQLGAKYMNFGNFEVNVEAQMVFSDAGVAAAIRNNTTIGMDFGLKNDDGALWIDIPAMTLGGGARDFPVNESVLINSTGEAFADPTLNTSIGISLFPIVP